jgi:hypothetical protein
MYSKAACMVWPLARNVKLEVTMRLLAIGMMLLGLGCSEGKQAAIDVFSLPPSQPPTEVDLDESRYGPCEHYEPDDNSQKQQPRGLFNRIREKRNR